VERLKWQEQQPWEHWPCTTVEDEIAPGTNLKLHKHKYNKNEIDIQFAEWIIEKNKET